MKLGLRRWIWIGIGLAATFGLAASGGCGDSASTGGGGAACGQLGKDGCFDATCVKAGPTRSFKTDVLPIFELSCSLSASCHGNPSSPKTGVGYQVYLGEVNPQMTPSDVNKILSLIVSKASPTATNLSIVEPGKPEASFLMLKMDGAVSCAAAKCTLNNCGTSMPQGASALPLETRNVVRDWIKQGAQNN